MEHHMLDIMHCLQPWRAEALIHDRQRDVIRAMSSLSSAAGRPLSVDVLYIVTRQELETLLLEPNRTHINLLCLSDMPAPFLWDEEYKGVNLLIVRDENVPMEQITGVLLDILMGNRPPINPYEILINALSAKDKNALACGIEFLFGNPVFIRDTSLELLSTSVKNHPVNAANFKEQPFCTQDMLEHMGDISEPGIMETCLLAPVFIQNILTAYVFIATYHVNYIPEDLEWGRIAAQAVSIEMQKSAAYRFQSGFSYDYFMIRLLESPQTSTFFINTYVKNLKLNFSGHIFCAVFELPKSSIENAFLIKKIPKDLNQLCQGRLYAVYKDSVVVLFCRDSYEPFRPDQRQELEAYLSMNGIRAGVSQCFSQLNTTSRYYQQVVNALVQAKVIGLPGNIFDIQTMMIYIILSNYASNHDLYNCIPPKIRCFLDFDEENGTDFFKTLQALIDNSMRIKDAAAVLYVHRNTIQYRLRKMKEQFDIDIDRAEDLFQIMLSQYIIELTKNAHAGEAAPPV